MSVFIFCRNPATEEGLLNRKTHAAVRVPQRGPRRLPNPRRRALLRTGITISCGGDAVSLSDSLWGSQCRTEESEANAAPLLNHDGSPPLEKFCEAKLRLFVSAPARCRWRRGRRCESGGQSPDSPRTPDPNRAAGAHSTPLWTPPDFSGFSPGTGRRNENNQQRISKDSLRKK